MDQFVIAFIDDVLIYSQSQKEHEENLRQTLQILKSYQLYVKLSKCEFWLGPIVFLAHMIRKKGIAVDLSKIKTVTNWPRFTNVSEVRSFLDLVGYYKRFV